MDVAGNSEILHGDQHLRHSNVEVTATNPYKVSKVTPRTQEAASLPTKNQYKKMHRPADSESGSRGSQAANAVCQ